MNKIIILLLISTISYSQSWNLSVQQDPKLLINGDGQTDKSSTLNLLVKTSYDFDSFNYNRIAYWTFLLSFEYADLRTTYQRYSTGFNYNLKLSKKFTGSVGYDFGLTYRGSDNTRAGNPQIKYITQSINGNIEYKLTDTISLIVTGQLVDRRDYYFWSSTIYKSKLIFSTFGGIKIIIL